MKLENMRVGMKVVVKPNASGYATEYIGTTQSLIVEEDCGWMIDVECASKGGEPVWVMSHEVRKATQEEIDASMPEIEYDIPQKAWLLREVVVTDDVYGLMGKHGFVSGVSASTGNVLIEFLDWNKGHNGIHADLLCGWAGDAHTNNYYFLDEAHLSFVNEDGSLTPITEESL